jgi:hypothetical protein
MNLPIEDWLAECGLRYTKEVDPQRGIFFHLPFEVSSGTVFVRLHVDEQMFASYVFLRRLDTIAVQTSRKDLFLDLLKLNATSLFARAGIWASKDEIEWILVTAESPADSLTALGLKLLVEQTVNLADQVAVAIQAHSNSPQRQLTE